MAETINITLHDEWPKVKLVLVDGRGGFRTEAIMYDVASSSFEPIVLSAVRAAVNLIVNNRKRIQNELPSR